MDGFGKTYEYEEDEKRVSGVLLIFNIMLLVCETIIGIILILQMYNALKSITVLAVASIILGILYISFILFTCFALSKIPKYAIKIVKTFLALRIVVLVLSSIVKFISEYNNKSKMGTDFFQYHSVNDAVLRILVLPIAYILIFSILWYLYFIKSKKVKEKYGNTEKPLSE